MLQRIFRQNSGKSNSSTPAPNSFQSRPFAPTPEVLPQPQETQDLEQLKQKALQPKTCGFNFANVNVTPRQTNPSPMLQRKLMIGEPNDGYEQEADRVARQVVDKINTPAPETVQRSQPQDEEVSINKAPSKPTMVRMQTIAPSITRPHKLVIQCKDGRTTLAERRQRLQQVRLVRQLLAAVPGLQEYEARHLISLHPGRTIAEVTNLAQGRPPHRTQHDLVRLARTLPGLVIADLITLAAAPATISINSLITLAQIAIPRRTPADLVNLATNLPQLGIVDLALLAHVPPPRTVAQLIRLERGRPPHRSVQSTCKLATDLSALSIDNLLLLLRLPPTRTIRHLRKLVLHKPNHRTITFMEALTRILRDSSVDTIIQLAHLPPARDMELQALAKQKPMSISMQTWSQLAGALPARGLNDLLALATLELPLPEIIQLGSTQVHRSGDDLVCLVSGLAKKPVADLVTLANIPPVTGMTANNLVSLGAALNVRTAADLAHLATNLMPGLDLSLVVQLAGLPNLTAVNLVYMVQHKPAAMTEGQLIQFAEDIQGFNLSALQLVQAAELLTTLRLRGVQNAYTVVQAVLGNAALVPYLDTVNTVVVNGSNLPINALVTCMGRTTPTNLEELRTHVGDLNVAAGLLANAGLVNQVLASDILIAHGDQVRTIITTATNMRSAALVTCMARRLVNLGILSVNVADLNVAAGLLANAGLVNQVLASDMLIARGNQVRAIISAATNIPLAVLVPVMTASVNNLNLLHGRIADINRALVGQQGLNLARLTNVLAHVQGNANLPVAQANLDQQLVHAQSLGGELRHILLTPLGQPGHVAYLNNLARAVDTLTTVVWGMRNGNFNNGGAVVNFGAAVRVPVSVGGFNLSNHVIAHLINPRNANHRVRISNIIKALNNYAATVIDHHNGGRRDWYQGDGLRLITPENATDIITIFFT